MKRALSSLLLTVALGAAVVGCAQKKAPPVAKSTNVPAATATLPTLPDDPPPSDVKEKRPRLGEAAVYLDGKPLGVLRPTELPLSLNPVSVHAGGTVMMMRYRFGDYFRAQGIDTKRIKAVHLYGGTRVVVVDQAENARIGERMMFSFTENGGKARMHWPPVKLNVNTTIDMLSSLAIYVDKEPPKLDAQGKLVMPDGTAVGAKVPYAPEEQGNGTRVYVDGTLVGLVKRKKLTDELLVSAPAADKAKASAEEKTEEKKDNAEDRFSLLAYAAKLSPKAKQAKSIDLVAGDDVIAQLTTDKAGKLAFNVPPRNRGQAVVDVPSADGALKRARVSAVQIYVNVAPPSRPVVKIDDAPEAAIRTDQGGSGSDDGL